MWRPVVFWAWTSPENKYIILGKRSLFLHGPPRNSSNEWTQLVMSLFSFVWFHLTGLCWDGRKQIAGICLPVCGSGKARPWAVGLFSVLTKQTKSPSRSRKLKQEIFLNNFVWSFRIERDHGSSQSSFQWDHLVLGECAWIRERCEQTSVDEESEWKDRGEKKRRRIELEQEAKNALLGQPPPMMRPIWDISSLTRGWQ